MNCKESKLYRHNRLLRLYYAKKYKVNISKKLECHDQIIKSLGLTSSLSMLPPFNITTKGMCCLASVVVDISEVLPVDHPSVG